MKPCPSCGEEILDAAIRCKHCGIDLDMQRCPWCAEVIDAEAKRCKHCQSYLAKIKCDGCGSYAEVLELRCDNCTQKEIEQAIGEWSEKNSIKNNLKNWIALVAIIAIAAFALSKVF